MTTSMAKPRKPANRKKAVAKSGLGLPLGDYRIIYTIDDKIVTVTITKAAHRGEAYK